MSLAIHHKNNTAPTIANCFKTKAVKGEKTGV